MESCEKPIEYTKSDHCVGKLLLVIIDLRERAVEKENNFFLISLYYKRIKVYTNYPNLKRILIVLEEKIEQKDLRI